MKPEVTLGEYKGVEVDKIDVEVTEEEVLEDIKKEQLQNARKVIVNDRPAKLDDEITLDFEDLLTVLHLKAEGRELQARSWFTFIHRHI